MREPWRNLVAQLLAADLSPERLAPLDDKPVAAIRQMVAKGINSPMSSSAGRLFDAVAATLNLAPERLSFEGQAAMALEAAVEGDTLTCIAPYPFGRDDSSGSLVIDPAPCWHELLADLQQGKDSSHIAARFHLGLAWTLVKVATELAEREGVRRVALSGGVFQNRHLFELVHGGLTGKGLEVLSHHQVPANDGGLALGQALIAAARSITERS